MEASDVDWETINEQLVYDHSEESHQKRRDIWNAMNVNDNKYLSLAEVDRGIRDVSSWLMQLIFCYYVLFRFWDWIKCLMPKRLYLRPSDLPKTHLPYVLRWAGKSFSR